MRIYLGFVAMVHSFLFGYLPDEITLIFLAFKEDVVHGFYHLTVCADPAIFEVWDFGPVDATLVVRECL